MREKPLNELNEFRSIRSVIISDFQHRLVPSGLFQPDSIVAFVGTGTRVRVEKPGRAGHTLIDK